MLPIHPCVSKLRGQSNLDEGKTQDRHDRAIFLTTELFCRVSCARERCSHPKDDYTDATNTQALLGAQLTPRPFGKPTSTFLIQTTPITPQSNCAVWPRAVHGKKSTPLFNRRTNAGFAWWRCQRESSVRFATSREVMTFSIIKSPPFQRTGFH